MKLGRWVFLLIACATLVARGQARPPGAGSGPTVARIHLRSGGASQIHAGALRFAALPGTPLLRTDELAVPVGEFLVVALDNGYLVRVDEDITLRVGDIVLLGAPRTSESLAAQLDRIVTREERVRAERVAGSQARIAAADAMPAESAPVPPAPPAKVRASAPKDKAGAPRATSPRPAPPKPSAPKSSSIFDDELGGGGGLGGLGLKGSGQGGGGAGQGTIGLGSIGTVGRGAGSGSGYGSGSGRLGGRATSASHVAFGALTVNGRLPPELVRRILQQHMARFRYCYEQALQRDPSLAGRIGFRFVIGADGAVANASLASSTIGDATLAACGQQLLRTLLFPKPAEGVVTVDLPVVFQSAGDTASDAPPPPPATSPDAKPAPPAAATAELPALPELRSCLAGELGKLPVKLSKVTVRVKVDEGRIRRVALGGGLPTPACASALLSQKEYPGASGTWQEAEVTLP